MNKKIYSKIKQPTRVIGIIGTGSGVGATHLAIMLSVFLSYITGRKTALVEKNDSGCFRQAEIILQNMKWNNKKTIKEISIYKQASSSELSNIMASGFEFVVVDFGHNLEDNQDQFLMCNAKIVVGSLSLWKIHELVGFLAKIENEPSKKYWAYLMSSPIQKGQKYLRNKFKLNVQVIPYEPDPFYLRGETMNFLKDLCKQFL